MKELGHAVGIVGRRDLLRCRIRPGSGEGGGDVQFIGRGAHESTNTGSKPTDFVIVAIK